MNNSFLHTRDKVRSSDFRQTVVGTCLEFSLHEESGVFPIRQVFQKSLLRVLQFVHSVVTVNVRCLQVRQLIQETGFVLFKLVHLQNK